MRTRAGLVALLLTAALAPEALGAKAVCRIVQDARGDAEYPRNGVPGDEGDDLLSADLASDGKQLTAVWRLADLRARNPLAPLGQSLVTYFQAPGTTRVLYVETTSSPSGPVFSYGYMAAGLGTALESQPLGTGRGVIDAGQNEARVTVPTGGFSPVGARFKRGTRIRSVLAITARVVLPRNGITPISTQTATFDEADGRAYVIGSPSCVRPVR